MELKDVKVTYTEEFIKEKLKNGICEFKYRKKDGSERSARGTRKSDVLKENGAEPSGRGVEKVGVIAYYDIDAEGWRSFNIENFIGFTTILAS